VLEPRGDEFIIIPMVYDPAKVVGELPFWLTIAASKEVRVDPIPETALVEPSNGDRTDQVRPPPCAVPAWFDCMGFSILSLSASLSHALSSSFAEHTSPFLFLSRQDSDEESDNDYEDWQLHEPAFAEHAVGGARSKGPPRERRTPRQIIECCAKLRSKYEDPDFPAGAEMLNRDASRPAINAKDVVFLRPCWRGMHDPREHLVAGAAAKGAGDAGARPPVLFEEQQGACLVKQGALGDGWLLGAMATVATKLDLLKALFVDWSLDWGVFTVRLFKNGKWHHVTVDDRLPARKDSKTLLFAVGLDASDGGVHDGPAAQRIMWVALLEKAYAKLHGCYENLARGTVPYGLQDLTGGAPQTMALQEDAVRSKVANGTLWRQLLDWAKSGCLLAVKFGGETQQSETDAARTLQRGRAYPIVDVREVRDGGVMHRMVRISNPWMAEAFEGRWKNSSQLWQKFPLLAEECRHDEEACSWLEAGSDEEFEASEFFRTFCDGALFVNRIFPASWQQSRMRAFWTKETAMGPPFQPEDLKGEWLTNPQWELHVSEPRTLSFIR